MRCSALQAAFAADAPITAAVAIDAIISDMHAYLREMATYLRRRTSVYGDWPLRLASYWDPQRGMK
eukprot:CAMPEP_0197601864 /NCGR_PEP_ID=MMETSP1326-20131121/36090_1 /TAXON_ID=1155430 /ORGANISM="Genus nov. species nov., Strain RCC2288" /LENGTH=65 /DNA_ID=CAMNT_0043169135 /DNA_START=1 /DNA_END=198 /DNA_ORIENTATION=-